MKTEHTCCSPSRCWRPGLIALIAAGLVLSVGVGFATAEEKGAKRGWIPIFWQKSLHGWKSKADDKTGEWQVAGSVPVDKSNAKLFAIESGDGVLVNGKTGRTVNLFTKGEHGDVEAHIEFVVPQGSNSGIYFQGRYEIQVLDSFGVKKPKYSDCGGIYQRWADGKGFEGHAPKVNASKAAGEWQTFDVTFRAPRFDAAGKKIENARFVKVVHNGELIHENVEVTGPTRAGAFADEQPKGPIMLQGDHGPVAYRDLRIRVVELP